MPLKIALSRCAIRNDPKCMQNKSGKQNKRQNISMLIIVKEKNLKDQNLKKRKKRKG